jgi:hypothetical protein
MHAHRCCLLLFTGLYAAAAADNVLTTAEKNGGWTLLFDGKTFANWRDPRTTSPPGDAWMIVDGCFKTVARPKIREDLVTQESFTDFELKFDWRISTGGNSGIKYRVQRLVYVDAETLKKDRNEAVSVTQAMADGRSLEEQRRSSDTGTVHTLGYEFQLADDASARKPLEGIHATGALYQMIAPSASAARPAGEWNESLLCVKGNRVEHWINGVKVLEGSLAYAGTVREGLEKRWGKYPVLLDLFAKPKPSGPIALQHHLTEVWFRNLKLRRLK